MLGCENALKFCHTSAVEYLLDGGEHSFVKDQRRLLVAGVFNGVAVALT